MNAIIDIICVALGGAAGSAGRIAASACYVALSLTLGLTAFFAAQRLASAI